MKNLFTLLSLSLLCITMYGQTNYGITRVGYRSYTQELSNIWGWTSPSGTEYALVGTTTGTSIVSLANPANPTQVQFIPGGNTMWRELKTYNNYGYVGCDNCSEGLLIIDLSTLPGSVNYNFYKPRLTVNGDTDTLRSIHTLYVEGNYLYLMGTNISAGETMIFSLTNPLAPQLVGFLPPTYAHDSYIRNDTLWDSNIYDGYFSVYDIRNKSNPVFLADQNTPSNFTHNAWLSNNSRTLFTTDERANAFVGSYDISNLNNIVELDRWQTFETRGTGVIPHNAHVVGNDFIAVSYYTDGVIILDGSRPDNLVEIARYDTYLQNQTGFYGCWGVYPYFNSGLIAASDINTGLHILQPNYQRACWLEGNITDTFTNAALGSVRVTINATPVFEDSRLNGDYKTGYGISGTYSVTYTKTGYYPKTISVNLQSGVVNLQNVQLVPMTAFSYTGRVVDLDNSNSPIASAKVLLKSSNYNYTATTDVNGNFTVPSMFMDVYDVYAGKWGYKTALLNIGINQGSTGPVIGLNRGYRDEFILDLGWTESGNATTGNWERAVSEEILFNGNPATPNEDLSFDLGNQCYITGANNNGSLSADDIDNGTTILRSPNFNLSTYVEPYLSYYAWFLNNQGSGTPNDSMIVRINNGSTSAILGVYNRNTPVGWTPIQNFKISDYITPTANMYLEVEAFDKSPGHIVEAAFDLFEVVDSSASPTSVVQVQNLESDFKVFPNPFTNYIDIDLRSNDLIGQEIRIFDVLGKTIYSDKIRNLGLIRISMNQKLASGMYTLKIGNDYRKLTKS